MQLSWACEEQLFRQEMENADDIRLSVRLFNKCMPDKRKVRGVSVSGTNWVASCNSLLPLCADFCGCGLAAGSVPACSCARTLSLAMPAPRTV